MNVMGYLPSNTQEEVNPKESGDVIGNDGLLVCGKCRKRKQKRISLMGKEKVVPILCDCRLKEIQEKKKKDEYEETMRRISRLKDASMMANKFRNATFSSYRIREENRKIFNLAKNYVQNFSEMRKKNQGILFYGPPGTGKSYTAACIANALMEKQISVIMTSFVKILQDIGMGDREAEYIQILNYASLLIIDDLGAERNTEYAIERVYNVIDSRIREEKPLILTTNFSLSEMMECEDIQRKRIYDRVFEACLPVEMPGKSFRQIEAAKRFDDMKKYME